MYGKNMQNLIFIMHYYLIYLPNTNITSARFNDSSTTNDFWCLIHYYKFLSFKSIV